MDRRTHGSSKRPAGGKVGAPARGVPFGPVSFLLGSVLIAAGSLTLYGLISEASDKGLGTLLLMTYAEAEVLGGLWMVLGIAAARTRWGAATAFAGFGLASLFQVRAGKCSCGCFGALPLDPWLTLVLDLAAVAVLLGSRVSGDAKDRPALQPVHWLGLGAVAMLIGLVGRTQADLVTVAGRVTEKGRPLEGASITFTGTSGKITLVTDREGRFRLPLVRPGFYSLWVPGTVPAPAPSPEKGGLKPSKAAATRPPQQRPFLWIEVRQCSESDKLIEL